MAMNIEYNTTSRIVLNNTDPKMLAMKALSQSALSASGIGFVAFPDSRFKKPQAAALASSKLRRELLAEGLVDLDQSTSLYSLSPAGRQWVAQYL